MQSKGPVIADTATTGFFDRAHDDKATARRPCFFAILNPMPSVDPKSVKVHLTSGEGVDIEWKDGHLSSFTFPYLRDACPCALCDEERGKSGREAGQPVKPKPGELPMFKPAVKPESAEGVGKYAIKFNWNDGHNLGIYSWKWLREICSCKECASRGEGTDKPEAQED
jgi:DUF971 family protein